MMTWTGLTKRAPELVALEREALAAYRGAALWVDFLADHQDMLRRAVGFMADNPALRTTEAYLVALKHLVTVSGQPRLWSRSRPPWCRRRGDRCRKVGGNPQC